MRPTPDRLPSRPLRNWFLAWHIHTGDPADVIARGFDLDTALVTDLLGGEAPLMLDTEVAIEACRMIRVAPEALWSSGQVVDCERSTAFDPPWSDVPRPVADVIRNLR